MISLCCGEEQLIGSWGWKMKRAGPRVSGVAGKQPLSPNSPLLRQSGILDALVFFGPLPCFCRLSSLLFPLILQVVCPFQCQFTCPFNSKTQPLIYWFLSPKSEHPFAKNKYLLWSCQDKKINKMILGISWKPIVGKVIPEECENHWFPSHSLSLSFLFFFAYCSALPFTNVLFSFLGLFIWPSISSFLQDLSLGYPQPLAQTPGSYSNFS